MASITIYCGDDIISSRKAFLGHIGGLKDKDFEIERINGKELSEESLELFSSPLSLFGQKKCLAIEGLLSIPKEKDKILKIVTLLAGSSFSEGGSDNYIVDWESKKFSKIEQLKLPNFIFKNYKLPSTLFNFLERLSPKRTKENLELFHKTIKEVDSAFVFLMLIRQFRLLILASESELAGIPSWQSGKLFKQAKLFEKQDLLEIYRKFLEIDFKQKTSQSPLDLIYELDLLIAEL